MNFFPLTFHLIFTVICLQSYMNLSDGFKWISLPSQRTKEHVGSTVHIKWYYECNDFGSSRIYYNNRHLFSRNANEQNYYALRNAVPHFSVIGGSNVTIIIPDVDKDKSGSYCCEVECGGDKDETCTFLLIYALPRIKYLASNVYGKKGDSMTLRCNASGHPAPRVTWIHKDTKRTIANSSVTSFNITDKESGGKYCCHVSNGFGNETNCTSLEMTDKPVIDNRLSSGNNVSSILGDTTHLRCAARGVPRPNIKWYTADGKIFSTGKASYPGGSELILTITRKQDYGMYRCRAENTIGVAWHNITVIQICQCSGNYQKYKRSLGRSSSIIKEPVKFIIWLTVTLVSGIVNIILIIFIKPRKPKVQSKL